VPIPLKIAGLVLGSTALYTYIGQLVPQKEVLPPAEVLIAQDATTADLVQLGDGIVHGKGLCSTCHTIGKSGALRFPDLGGIASRAETRMAGQTGLQYMARSIYHPDEFIVEGFTKGMPIINKPPIGLNDQEILAVLAYLQTLGGEATVTLATTKQELGVE
jgi:mono/diheme cytochrome c family protein